MGSNDIVELVVFFYMNISFWMKSLKECDFLECQYEYDFVKF